MQAQRKPDAHLPLRLCACASSRWVKVMHNKLTSHNGTALMLEHAHTHTHTHACSHARTNTHTHTYS